MSTTANHSCLHGNWTVRILSESNSIVIRAVYLRQMIIEKYYSNCYHEALIDIAEIRQLLNREKCAWGIELCIICFLILINIGKYKLCLELIEEQLLRGYPASCEYSEPNESRNTDLPFSPMLMFQKIFKYDGIVRYKSKGRYCHCKILCTLFKQLVNCCYFKQKAKLICWNGCVLFGMDDPLFASALSWWGDNKILARDLFIKAALSQIGTAAQPTFNFKFNLNAWLLWYLFARFMHLILLDYKRAKYFYKMAALSNKFDASTYLMYSILMKDCGNLRLSLKFYKKSQKLNDKITYSFVDKKLVIKHEKLMDSFDICAVIDEEKRVNIFDECNWCHKQGFEFKICGGCKLSFYCSKKCQKLDWKLGTHKIFCNYSQCHLQASSCLGRLTVYLMSHHKTVEYLNGISGSELDLI
eukprot:391140_1